MKSPSEELQFAIELADLAATEIVSRFQRTSVERKPDGSEVTEADRQAEIVMRRRIAEQYPHHGVLGEEGGDESEGASACWVLDPIDGTAWFALGIPKFGTMIALVRDRTPVLGVIHLPITDETLFAELGRGCWYRRGGDPPQRVRVDADVTRIEDAFLSSAGVHRTDIVPAGHSNPIRLASALRRARRVRFVGDCVQHMLVARGRLHAAIDASMKPWDIAALVPCVLEAGGVVSDVAGRTDDIVHRDSFVSACTPELHAELLEIFAGHGPSSHRNLHS